MKWHQIAISCPRCKSDMSYAAYFESTPHVVEYHCDKCAWKGDYNHNTGEFDEFSAEDYVISENTTIDHLLQRLHELGGEAVPVEEDE